MEETNTELQKLDPEFKARWVEALRSGSYSQGDSKLAQYADGRITYCCLGVACVTEGIPTEAIMNCAMPSSALRLNRNNIKVNDFLTKSPNSDDGDPHYILSKMNDDGKSFEEIATWIDENL